MGQLPTDPARSALMKRVRRSGTPAELVVAEVCRSSGLAYRLNVRSLPGSPDLANKARRWAIFVNGCYWHHHTGCARGTVPTRNREFWIGKFIANRRRDAAKIQQLRAAGFRVLLVWECEVADEARLRSRLAQICAKRVS